MAAGKGNWNKRFYIVHGWIGLNCGLILFVICLSGSFAVVSHEIDWLLNPVVRATPQPTRASYGEMTRAVERAYPESPIRSIWAPKGPRFACEFWVRGTSGGNRRVYVDPYTAKVQGEAPWFNTQRFFRDFHRRFFVDPWWGIWLVTIFAPPLFFASATGLAFYKRWWAKLLTLRLRGGGRLAWSDLHRLLGLWTLLFSLLIAITGGWYFVEIPLGWNIKSPRLPKLPKTSIPAADSEPQRLAVDDWVRAAEETLPDLEVRTIWFPANRGAVVKIDGQASAWLVRDRANTVLVDPFQGTSIYHQRAERMSPYWRWVDTADPLHFGDFGGLASKLVWFALGLMLSLLMPTGAYLWSRRAAQIGVSTDKRLARAEGVLKPDERKRLVRGATRRHLLVGISSTTAVLAMAAHATYQSLADQAAKADSAQQAVELLGGAGAIAVYGSFCALILAVTFFWYRCIWFSRPRAS